jgi:predicted transposase/invertase (TIGR01784 family)
LVGRYPSAWRNVSFLSRLLTQQLLEERQNGSVDKAVIIFITDFIINKESDKYHYTGYFSESDGNIDLSHLLEAHILELPKLKQSDGSQLFNWMQFFRAQEEEEFEIISQTNPAIAEAWGDLKALSNDESFCALTEGQPKTQVDSEDNQKEDFQGIQPNDKCLKMSPNRPKNSTDTYSEK